MRDVLERDWPDTAADQDRASSPGIDPEKAVRWPTGFAMTFVLAFTAVLAAALLVNYLGNGSEMMPSSWSPSRSERAWKTRRIEDLVRAGQPPQAIIMGSSRVMEIRPDYVQAITGEHTFNYGVSMGCPVDFLTQLRYLLRLDARPNLLIVGVDEFAFGDNAECDYYDVQLAGHFGLFQQVPILDRLRIAAVIFKAISTTTTKKSLSNLLNGPPPLAPLEAVEDILLADGYRLSPGRARAVQDGTSRLEKGIARSLKFWGPQLNTPEAVERMRPNGRRFDLFVEFLELARSNRIQVRVMLLPLQPDFASRILTPRLTAIRAELSRKLQVVCAENGAVYRDLSDLASFQGDPTQFGDGTHATDDNLRRLTNVLFDLNPDLVVARLPADQQILEHLPPVNTLDTR